MLFSEFGLAENVLRAVTAEGYTQPTPIQEAAIPLLLEGRDLLGVAQTGTGKTAAFALPILTKLAADPQPAGQRNRKLRVLILAPTRELAAQIGDSIATYGRETRLRHAVIFGGVNQFHQVRALRGGIDILVATPGRLLDLLNQGHVNLAGIDTLVLDEADRMFDMGFLPDLKRIVARLPRERQTVLFSATMPPPIEELAHNILHDPARVFIKPQQATIDLIEQQVYFVPVKTKQPLLESIIESLPRTRTMVFTRTKHGADRVVKHLDRAGITSAAIHGNKSQAARQKALEAFRAGRLHVLVATDLASRGLDVDDVTHVFNFDLPNEPETYVHRVGRTGRAGASGVAISLVSSEERSAMRAVERLTGVRMLPQPLPEGLPASRELRFDEPEAPRANREPSPARSAQRPSQSRSAHHAAAVPSGRPTTYVKRRKKRFAAGR